MRTNEGISTASVNERRVMNYAEWNAKITKRFFSQDCEGRRVFLAVTKDFIEELGGTTGVQDFIAAVKQGPDGCAIKSSLCARILDATERWRQQGAPDCPPYIATLGLFVLAASYDAEEESESRSYHKRLRALLGEPENYQPIHKFYDCVSIWDDLETWSNHDKKGDLGGFRVEFYGNWMYVGIPIAQTLLTETERSALPRVFSAAGLDPAIPYSDAHIAAAVAEHGRGLLLRRTIKRLNREGGTSEEIREALLERLHEELAQWQISDDVPQDDDRVSSCSTARPTRVLVSLQYLAVSRTVETKLFFDGRSLDADSSFQLRSVRTGKVFSVEVERGAWSQPFFIKNNVAQATELDWHSGDDLKCESAELKFLFAGGQVRIFEAGSNGVAHLLERGRLPAHGAFWLAVARNTADVIEWGQNHCRGWQEVRVDAGLPDGWRLFKVEEAVSTVSIEQNHPSLSLPSFARIVLTGGLKLGRANRYLSSSPPQVAAQTPPGEFILTCNDLPLTIGPTPISVPLESLQERNVVELRATAAPDKTRKCVFYLVQANSLPWKAGLEFGYSAWNGAAGKDDGTRISGALVLDREVPPFPLQSMFDHDAVTLLGKSPGQIANSNESIDWPPVWIVSKGRNRRVFFCGSTVENSAPNKIPSGDRKAIRKWREMIYYGRRSIQPPRHRRLAELWTNYILVAKDV